MQDVDMDQTYMSTLLKILYDPRLKAGMTKEEAAPIVRQIIVEMFPEP